MELSTVGQPHKWQMGFQDAASPVMASINEVHSLIMWVISGVFLTVVILLAYIIYKFRASKNPEPSKFVHNTALEIIWTAIPVILLIVIGVPSIRLLHKMDKPTNADMTVKVVGHQWYWSYEYTDPNKDDQKIEFDSYMIEDEDLKPGQLRLFDVDNPMVVPVGAVVKVLVTASDVIHSFAVPSLGVKKDAVPGRINETWFKVNRPGVYYGQCSELCGAKHGFMPIAVKAVLKEEYERWIQEKSGPKPISKSEAHKALEKINKEKLDAGN